MSYTGFDSTGGGWDDDPTAGLGSTPQPQETPPPDFAFNQDPNMPSYDDTTGAYKGPTVRSEAEMWQSKVTPPKQPDETSGGTPYVNEASYNDYFAPTPQYPNDDMWSYQARTGDAGPVFPDLFRQDARIEATNALDRASRNGKDNFTPYVMDGDGNWTTPDDAERIRTYGRDKAASSTEPDRLNPATGLPDTTFWGSTPTRGVDARGVPVPEPGNEPPGSVASFYDHANPYDLMEHIFRRIGGPK